MKVIDPIGLSVIESSVPEDDAPLWSESTPYAKLARVMDDHRIYEALVEHTGKRPADHCSGTDAAWRPIGPTNRWACVDEYISTQTVAPEGAKILTMTVPFDRCTGFALLNFKATSVRAVVTDADGEVLHDVTTPTLKDVRDWWEFYFLPLDYQIDLVVTDVPISPKATLTVSLAYELGPRLGHIVAGSVWQLGSTLYQVQSGLRDYSRKEVNEFGEARLIPRATARTQSLPLYLHPDEADSVTERLRALAGRPALWIGDNRDSGAGGHQTLTVYGWLDDWRIAFAGPNETGLNLDLQGLI